MIKILTAIAVTSAALAASATAAAPPVTITFAANAALVDYGKPVALSGTLSNHKANQSVVVQAIECGSTKAARAANVKTTANGAFTASITPALATSYQATYKGSKSPALPISVRPVLQLVRVARGSYTAKVTAGRSLKGKIILFQRYAKLRKRWVQVKRVTLVTETPGTAKPTMITSASFKAKAPRRARVRLLISKLQASPCYVTAKSNVVRA
jgi:hypothetical protein